MDDYKDQIIKAARQQEAAELGYKPPVFERGADGRLNISDNPVQVTASDFAAPHDIDAEAFQRDYARKIKAEEARQKVSVQPGPVIEVGVQPGPVIEVGELLQTRETMRGGLLQTRETTHGDYGKTAETAQALKTAMYNARRLPRADMRESIDLICTKMARIANGDPTEPDHWRDIAGYAQLVAERLERAA